MSSAASTWRERRRAKKLLKAGRNDRIAGAWIEDGAVRVVTYAPTMEAAA